MRGKKAKRIRKQVYGNMCVHLIGRKYKGQMVPDHTSGALITTGGIVSVGLRREYQQAKRCGVIGNG
ncbi:MAG: hypothetical protein V3U75_12825 [Methylococcaceae bacterium]